MTRSTILAGSLALSAVVTVVLVHRTDAQDGPRPIPPNLTSYLVPFRQLYDLETSFPRWPLPAGQRAYASFDGARIKQDVDAITAISRRSRDSGAQVLGTDRRQSVRCRNPHMDRGSLPAARRERRQGAVVPAAATVAPGEVGREQQYQSRSRARVQQRVSVHELSGHRVWWRRARRRVRRPRPCR